MTTLDLSLVQEVLADASKSAAALDGTGVNDTTLGNKPAAAQLNRELLNLADQLEFASALVRNTYWFGKGMTSYDL